MLTWRQQRGTCGRAACTALLLRRGLIDARARALHEANVAVEFFPLVPPGKAFAMDFWNGVIHAADDDEGGAAFSEGADTVYRLQACPLPPSSPCLSASCGYFRCIAW